MPCSCDGYAPRTEDQLRDEKAKVDDLEKRLCKAQSLIHKILAVKVNVVDNGNNHYTSMRQIVGAGLTLRADAQIAELLKHKRAEHDADRVKARLKRDEL